MKKLHYLIIATIAAMPVLHGQEITAEFADVDNFTDFSVYGLSEEKTLKIFQAEFEDVVDRAKHKYLKEGESLHIVFQDIDMAGDIQPWRNRQHADIRYIEDVYPPRLKFSYVLKDANGETVLEGEDAISDLAYQMNTLAPMRTQYRHFFYETTLLDDWMRRKIRDR